MINKRISKITMLTCLMLAGVVNAQEFYTCVPKKNTVMNININNVDELAKAITKIGGAGGGGTNANQKKWQLIKTIDFKTRGTEVGNVLELSNLGTYKFKMYWKYNNKLKIFEQISTTTSNYKIHLIKQRTGFCKSNFSNFLYGYDKTKAVYLNKNSKCDNTDDAGLVSINLDKTCLFIYECLAEFNACVDVDKVLKDSILEIYRKIDED